MDFIFWLTPDSQYQTGILIWIDLFSKITHLVSVHATITAVENAALCIDAVLRHHGLPENTVSDRDPFYSHPHFGRHCSSFLGLSCRCRQRLIRTQMGKSSL